MLYMIVLRFFAGAMAWTVVILVNLLFVAATVLSAHKSGLLSSVPGTDGLADILAATGNELTGTLRRLYRWMATAAPPSCIPRFIRPLLGVSVRTTTK